MASVYGGNVPNVFHKTLGAIWQTTIDNQRQSWKAYLEETSTDKRFFDDVGMVDPGLWSETDEGTPLALDSYSEGYITRYRPKKMSKRLVIPEEIIEDAAYEEAYDATRMLARTCVQTQNYDACSILNNATTAGFTGGDGVTLGNLAHPLKGGATVSNLITLSPSNAAVDVMLVACERMLGDNGYIAGVRLVKLFGPSQYKRRFKEILKSEKKDDTANNAINALKGELSDQYGSVPEMSSTTNWGGRTNVMRGAMFVWRRKPRYRQTPSRTDETIEYTGSARWVVSWSNWRTYQWSNI